MRWSPSFIGIAVFAASAFSGGAEGPGFDPAVESVLHSFQLADDQLVIEPAAAEPNVVDPVAVTWDENGGMYAVEMRDYPFGGSTGVVRRLIDSDRDGIYETSTVFAQGLPLPTSAVPWNGGIIVAAAPDLVFLKDTNDDGAADERRVLFSGFGQGLPHYRVNSLHWGLDNWVYAANGGSDGVVVPAAGGSAGVSIARRDLRFQPDRGVIEAVTGLSQNGATQTPWGDRLVSWAASPFRQVITETRYSSDDAPGVGDVSILEWFDKGRIWPVSPTQARFSEDSREYFHSARGLTVYSGDALAGYAGNAFVCEPEANVVHRRILRQNGSLLVARRGESGLEFLASTHPWFRPVYLATGPDGALYIVDFCREHIEHPSVAPDDVRDSVDWRSGDRMGRIWRVRPKVWSASAHETPRLSAESHEELANRMASPNGWIRNQAQRLLIEKRATDAAAALRTVSSKTERPEGRVAALWTLDALGELDDDSLRTALSDRDAHVRREAVRIAEPRLGGSPDLVQAVIALAKDPEPLVRHQVAQTATYLPRDARLDVCRTIANLDDNDPWICGAVLRSAGDDAWAVLDSVLAGRQWDLDWWASRHFDFAVRMAEVVGATGRKEHVAALLQRVTDSRPATGLPDVSLLSGLSRGLSRAGQPLKLWLSELPSEPGTAPAERLQRAFDAADYIAHCKNAGVEVRGAAIRLLLERPEGDATEELLAMLKPDERPDIVNAIVEALGERGGEETNQALLDRWAGLSKDVRDRLVDQFVAVPAQTAMLLDALEQGVILKHEIEVPGRNALLQSGDEQVRERASRLYPLYTSPAKEQLVTEYTAAFDLPADSRRGATHYVANCFPCHQMHGIGNTVGPELSTASEKPREHLLRSILDPSSEVLPAYISYSISTKNFEDYGGLMVRQDASSVTLRAAGGMEQVVQRTDIESMSPSALSLMPEGLEVALDKQAIADLIAFIQQPDMEALKEAVAQSAPQP